jgi:hypothetical protein
VHSPHAADGYASIGHPVDQNLERSSIEACIDSSVQAGRETDVVCVPLVRETRAGNVASSVIPYT